MDNETKFKKATGFNASDRPEEFEQWLKGENKMDLRYKYEKETGGERAVAVFSDGYVEYLEAQHDYALEMLSNIQFWGSCPDDYKKRIKKLLEDYK